MDFYTVLDQVLALLRQRGRVSYRASSASSTWTTTLWRICKEELLYAHHPVADEDGRAWSGLVRLEAQPRHPRRTNPPPAQRAP